MVEYRGYWIDLIFSPDDERKTGVGWYAEVVDSNGITVWETELVSSKTDAFVLARSAVDCGQCSWGSA